jgi:hypothetical protein
MKLKHIYSRDDIDGLHCGKTTEKMVGNLYFTIIWEKNKIIVLVLTYTLFITAIYIHVYTQIIRIVHKFASLQKTNHSQK